MPSPTTTIDAIERVRYFSRQLITADDMRAEQEYLLQKMRRHNRMLHGAGVVCGLMVAPATDGSHPLRVSVGEGYALTPHGDDVWLPSREYLDLADCGRDEDSACTPALSSSVVVEEGQKRPDLFVGIRYDECPSRPVRVMPAGCGCGDSSCDYSRTRDYWKLGCWPVPKGWEPEFPAGGCGEIAERLTVCPSDAVGRWVILARVTFGGEVGSASMSVNNSVRRLLFSTAALQGACCSQK